MITGAFKETTGIMICPAAVAGVSGSVSNIITLENMYFVVERITGSVDDAVVGMTCNLNVSSGDKNLSNIINMPIVTIVTAGGMYREDGKAVLIFSPNDQLTITFYNSSAQGMHCALEFEGYYCDDNGIRFGDGQHFTISRINSVL